ncbi:replication protein A1, large subunit, putative [Plasmodium ovale wallikeri]|uniref:Replication protein A1, large subunit, putative n=1 Tax=Plasmodium ovale wallikeri TaxID=864142 RepID=A0A1A8YHW8_PLAOA|nr:replication protein A1, large subunit, putative [Plasmodium ovale wallikeri]
MLYHTRVNLFLCTWDKKAAHSVAQSAPHSVARSDLHRRCIGSCNVTLLIDTCTYVNPPSFHLVPQKMNQNEEILSKATPNFISKFFTEPDSEETLCWLNSEVHLICFSQMNAGANQTFLKVIDGTIPPQYYAIIHLGPDENTTTGSTPISYVKKIITIEKFSITNYYGKLFILAKKVSVFLSVDNFDIEDLFRIYHLQSISYLILNSRSEAKGRNKNNSLTDSAGEGEVGHSKSEGKMDMYNGGKKTGNCNGGEKMGNCSGVGGNNYSHQATTYSSSEGKMTINDKPEVSNEHYRRASNENVANEPNSSLLFNSAYTEHFTSQEKLKYRETSDLGTTMQNTAHGKMVANGGSGNDNTAAHVQSGVVPNVVPGLVPSAKVPVMPPIEPFVESRMKTHMGSNIIERQMGSPVKPLAKPLAKSLAKSLVKLPLDPHIEPHVQPHIEPKMVPHINPAMGPHVNPAMGPRISPTTGPHVEPHHRENFEHGENPPPCSYSAQDNGYESKNGDIPESLSSSMHPSYSSHEVNPINNKRNYTISYDNSLTSDNGIHNSKSKTHNLNVYHHANSRHNNGEEHILASSSMYRKDNKFKENGIGDYSKVDAKCANPCLPEETMDERPKVLEYVAAPGFEHTSYTHSGYPQSGYPQSGYPQKGYPQNGYPQNGYPQSGYPQNGYPQNGYPQSDYPQSGYPQSGYPQSGYPQNGYPQSGYPQNGYPQNGYPRDDHPLRGNATSGTNSNNDNNAGTMKGSRSGELISEKCVLAEAGGGISNKRDSFFSSSHVEDNAKKMRIESMESIQDTRETLNPVDEMMERRNEAKLVKDNSSGRYNRKSTPYQNSAVIKTNDGILMPINKLSQYSSKWIIKARVQSKDNIRKFYSGNKEGKVFNIELCDEDGEIKVNFFGKAVDKWYEFLQVGKIYKISRGNIKAANKKFNTLKHDCEITLDENSIIELLEENDNIPKFIYNFISIDSIKNMNTGSLVDVIGIVLTFQDAIQILIKKTGQYKEKRDLVLIDESNETINVTLWGDHALKVDEIDLRNNCIICFKHVKIGEWQGKKLESHPKTKIEINPEIDRSYILKNWWDNNKQSIYNSININSNVFNIELQKSIEDIKKDVNAANDDALVGKGIIFTTFGFIDHIYNSLPVYSACPDCNKKMITNVVEDEMDSSSPAMDESMYCAKCDKNNVPIYNYSVNLKITDNTDSLRASAFANCAKTIMNGMSADDFMKLRQEYISQENIENFDVIEKVKLNEFFFRIKAYMTSHMDEVKRNYTILEAIPLNKLLVDNCKFLIKSIKSSAVKDELGDA